MATILNPDDPNNNQPKAPGGLQTIGTAAPSTGAPSKPQGSGRFTNIQKYIQANTGGGQKVASQVGSNIQKDFQKNIEQAKKYNEQLGQSIQDAKKVAGTRGQYETGLENIESEIKSAQEAGYDNRGQQQFNAINKFTSDPNFNAYQDLRSGRAIDENLLAQQQQRAASQAQQTAQGSIDAQQALGSEGGRFNLLRSAFGGQGRTGYTEGQQRLDSTLLDQGGGLGNLQSDIAKQAQAGLSLAGETRGRMGDVSQLAAQEKGIMSNLGELSSANEAAYRDMLSSYIDPLNQQRAQEFTDLGKAAQYYAQSKKPSFFADPNKSREGFTDEQMARLGVNKDQGVYNVFKDEKFQTALANKDKDITAARNIMASNIATKGADAVDYRDVANIDDVTRYGQLAKMMGSDFIPGLTQESQIGDAYSKATGSSALDQRLYDAQKDWEKNSAQKMISGTGTASGQGRYGDIYTTSGASARVGDLINTGQGSLRNSFIGSGGYDASKLRGQADATARANAIANLNKLLAQQNYRQTLGGERTIALDTDNNLVRSPAARGNVGAF